MDYNAMYDLLVDYTKAEEEYNETPLFVAGLFFNTIEDNGKDLFTHSRNGYFLSIERISGGSDLLYDACDLEDFLTVAEVDRITEFLT